MLRTAAAILLGAVLAAQRSPLFATVVDADGLPLEEAEVTCVHSPGEAEGWPLDVVRARTDARGRARCELLPGLLYTAWAVGAEGRAVTAPRSLIAAGRVVELRACVEHAPRSVALSGVAAWREAGAVGVLWFPDQREHASVALPLPDGDVVEVPASCWARGALALADGRGRPMVATALDPGSCEAAAFDPPVEIQVRTVSSPTRPVAGCDVTCRVAGLGNWWAFPGAGNSGLIRSVGKTDEDGYLRFHASCGVMKKQKFGGSMPSFVTAFADRRGHGSGSAGIVRPLGNAIRLPAARAVRVEVRGSARDRVAVSGIASWSHSPIEGTHAFGWRRVPTTSSEPGSWVVHGVGERFRLDCQVAASPSVRVLGEVYEDVDRVVLDLDRAAPIQVSVRDQDGGPAACGLAISRLSMGHTGRLEARMATDLAGRAQLWLGNGPYLIYALDGERHAIAQFDADARADVELRLAPIPKVRLEVVDASGRPVVGARVRPVSVEHAGAQEATLEDAERRLMSSMFFPLVGTEPTDRRGLCDVLNPLKPGMAGKIVVYKGSAQSDEFELRAGMAQPIVVTLEGN